MKTVYIGSENPVKIKCTINAFGKVYGDLSGFRFTSVPVESGVCSQPISHEETLRGAKNRVMNIKELFRDGDFYVGIEGGLAKTKDGMEAFALVVVEGKKVTGQSQTATFQVPPNVIRLIEQGMELGHAIDEIFNQRNSKQHGGAVGALTDGVIDRNAYYTHAIVLAMIPHIKPNLYS